MDDLRRPWRALLREPGFALISVLTLALGIGANTAIFSIVNGVLLRPLEYREPDRLVALWEVVPAVAKTYPLLPASARHFTEWRQRASSFESLTLMETTSLNLTGAGEPERVPVALVAPGFFDTLGAGPAIGRGFVEGENQDGHDRVAVISDALWRRRFHADAGILGKIITLDNQDHRIVGVLPAGFVFPSPRSGVVLPVPVHPEVYKPKVFSQDEMRELMGQFNYPTVARLRPGVSPRQASAELNLIAADLVKLSGEKTELRASVVPLRESMLGGASRGLLVLLGAVAAVLLIVCVNLANLALARAERHSIESAIRTALGASRGRLMRRALAESLSLALLGGLLGVAVAWGALGSLVALLPQTCPG